MIKKQIRNMIIVVAALLVVLCLYVYLINPVFIEDDPAEGTSEDATQEEKHGALYNILIQPWVDAFTFDNNSSDKEKIELLEGETFASASTILMFDQVPRANIQSIEVFNSYGSYKFFYDSEKEDFFIEGYLNAPYSKEMISALVTNAGFPVTMRRVATNVEDLSEYGLAESDNPAYYILTARTGETYKVYIGDMIATGAGFYTKYAERDAVYITEASISQTLLGPVENLITPMMFIPTTQSDYFLVKDFLIIKDGKRFVEVTSKTTPAKDNNGNEYEEFVDYMMVYPEGYQVSENYDHTLQGFMECYGNRVLELGKDDELFTDELLEKYNLLEPKYQLLFKHNGIENIIAISEKTEDGRYYAFSLLFNLICDVPEELFAFLEWDLLNYVNKPLLQYNINDISSITVTSKDFDETFILYVSDGATTTNPVTGSTTTAKNLEVKMKSTGEYVKNPSDFRQFYMGILTTNAVTYADVESEEGLELLATLKIITRSGDKFEYAFYPYHTRRCFFTLNGTGEFYVLKDSVEKIVNDAKRVTKGEPVSYLDKN